MLSVEESKVKDDATESKSEQQAELTKLQRQYRLLVDDRKAYRNEAEHTLKRQRQVIANLMREEEDLVTDMNLFTQRSNQIADGKILEQLRFLLKSENVTKMAIDDETVHMEHFQGKLKRQKEKIEKLSKELGGPGKDQNRYNATQKRIRMLESRLNQATVRLNKTLARNSAQRQNIENISVQRCRFADLHKKLRKLYDNGMNEKNRLMDCSKALFTSRVEADHRMKNLQEKAARDLSSFTAELKDLERIIDHDERLREFMTTKDQDLIAVYEQVVQGRRNKKASANARVLQNEVEFYDEIFQRLIDVSGDSDVNSMVSRFIATEDQNFVLFNFVNEQEAEKKQLEIATETKKSEIVEMGNRRSTMTTERKKILSELEESFDRVCQIRKENNREDKIAKKIFDDAKVRIWDLFQRIGCDINGISLMLGNTVITEDNMAQFLGKIEKKANEMLQVKLMLALKESNEHEVSLMKTVRTGFRGKSNPNASWSGDGKNGGLAALVNYSPKDQ